MDKENGINQGKSKKILLIVIIADVILVVGAVLAFVFLFKGESPEDVAEKVMDASVAKDWEKLIYLTPDEVFTLIVKADPEDCEKIGVKNADELRGWALDHISEVADPMNGKAVKDYKVGEVKTMNPYRYVEEYLYVEGDDDNPYYPFLKSKEEVALVEIQYTVVDGDKETPRTDTVVEYKKDGNWYPLTGIQLIVSMMQK